MVKEEPKESTQNSNQATPIQNDRIAESLFSPRFKSIAAMAGWDEEALVVASLVVEDTPDRTCKHKKRANLVFVSPPSTNSRRKRRAQRRSAVSIPVASLNLDDEETSKEESEKKKMEEQKIVANGEKKKTGRDEMDEENTDVSCSNPALPCIDKLREELSCAICLEICYEPSTTPCGHSFCKKCLRFAADKCGKKCPKCRQLISNGRSCTVNTVLWNTIQLLFPQEVEARKASGGQQADLQSPVRGTHSNRRTWSSESPMENGIDTRWRRRGARSQNDEDDALAARLQRQDNLSQLISSNTSSRRRRGMPSQDADATPLASRLQRDTSSRRRGTPSQDADAALALRLQREEFMGSFGRNHEQSRAASLSLARANLRAVASRAINIRTRGQ